MLSKIEASDTTLPVIYGIEGTKLTKDEKAFFKDVNPLGFILFARNIADPKQMEKLTKSMKDLLGRDAPILIDQEGGRVQRMKEPHWDAYPPARHFADQFTRDFAKGKEELEGVMDKLAHDLYEVGINVNCAPVLDVEFPETHEAIGDRSYSSNPQLVALMGSTVCRAFLKNGVLPVVKHMPGQGRATQDSHDALPEVDSHLEEMEKTDLLPYREIMGKTHSEALWGMVNHVVYKQVDPDSPASCSRAVIYNIIRDRLGFQGLLLTDDICMGALKIYGDMQYRAEKALRSGCDIALHCNGNLEQMVAVADRCPAMTVDAISRYNKSTAWLRRNMKVEAA